MRYRIRPRATLLALALTLGAPSCAATTRALYGPSTPQQVSEYAAAVDALERARETDDPADDEVAEAEIARIEQDIFMSKAGPLVGGLSLIPGVGPWAAALSPILLPIVGAFGARGRKHLANVVRDLNPQSGRPFSEVFGDLARFFGWAHSSEASKAAAEAETA